tara:strand:+ start:79 stop:354 length:276 start_codon:yes stop_codon:yes gene_type:complete
MIFSLALLSACAQSTALIGPAITVGNTGNIMQASFSYGSNMAVKRVTGKTPGEHATSFVIDKREEKKIRKEIASYLESHIEIMRKKLSVKK